MARHPPLGPRRDDGITQRPPATGALDRVRPGRTAGPVAKSAAVLRVQTSAGMPLASQSASDPVLTEHVINTTCHYRAPSGATPIVRDGEGRPISAHAKVADPDAHQDQKPAPRTAGAGRRAWRVTAFRSHREPAHPDPHFRVPATRSIPSTPLPRRGFAD